MIDINENMKTAVLVTSQSKDKALEQKKDFIKNLSTPTQRNRSRLGKKHSMNLESISFVDIQGNKDIIDIYKKDNKKTNFAPYMTA